MTITNIDADFIQLALNDAIEKRAIEILDVAVNKYREEFLEKMAKALPEIILKVQSNLMVERNLQGLCIDVRIRN
jgi:hypothetical protein